MKSIYIQTYTKTDRKTVACNPEGDTFLAGVGSHWQKFSSGYWFIIKDNRYNYLNIYAYAKTPLKEILIKLRDKRFEG